MIISVQWDKIKRGYKGFENLATKYVEINYPNPAWKKTKDTRDGNKDATAIFCGYQKNGWSEEKWWMEAKYSVKTDMMTRYRLDSTIVSAILEKNINRIIFVTNIAIRAKTINDIRSAIFNAIQCDDVIFVTKFTLEYWLSMNPQLYRKYFVCPSCNEELIISMPTNVIIQNIDFYSEISNKLVFKEPLKELEINKIYIGYFEVFSSQNITYTLRLKEKRKGIKILNGNNVDLKVGENPVSFKLKIEKDYDITLYKGKSLPVFMLGNTELVTSQYISIVNNCHKNMKLLCQENILNQLSKDHDFFMLNTSYCFSFIKGVSGVGKSYILERFMTEQIQANEDVFYTNLYDSSKINNEILINLILFVLFPYIDPLKIDNTYLEEIPKKFISKKLADLVRAKESYERMAEEFAKIDFEDDFFVANIEINRRIIILDNLHKLDDLASTFLSVLLANIAMHNLPILFIGAAQPDFFSQSKFSSSKYCIKSYKCDINIRDLIYALNCDQKPVKYINQNLALSLEFNVIELFFLTQELLRADEFPNSFDSFIQFCKIFQSSRIIEEYVCKQFDSFLSTHPECLEICNLVYWSSVPIDYDEPDSAEVIRLLIDSGLIQRNYESMLVPFHDIYREFYRKHYPIDQHIISYFGFNSPEYLYFSLKSETNFHTLDVLTKRIMEMVNKKYFHSVIYILQGIFEVETDICLQRRWGEKIYYQLRFAYSLALKQQGNGELGYNYLEEIRIEVDSLNDVDSLKILLEVYWEIAISDYEKMNYQKSRIEIGNIFRTLKKINYLENGSGIKTYIKYHDALMLYTLICANENKPNISLKYAQRISIIKKNHFEERAKSFQIRYALTLCVHDVMHCLELLKDATEYFQKQKNEDDKYYLWGLYHYYYYKMIIEKKSSLCDYVIKVLDELKKNFYSNYRGRINGIASYFYSINDIATGDHYLMKEAKFEGRLDGRQEAFHYETIALHEVLVHSYSTAISNLNRAIVIFDKNCFYRMIPEHNIKVLENIKNTTLKICYWWGEELQDNVYYIDSRCAW